MAEGYNEYKTPQQSNINWGETFKMAVKAPAIADRIFEKYEDADNYVKHNGSSAVAGLVLTVFNDPDASKNGIYFVNYDYTTETPVLKLFKNEGAVQSNWLEEDTTSLAYIRNRPTCDYGTFRINDDGTVTETPYAEGYINYDMLTAETPESEEETQPGE